MKFLALVLETRLFMGAETLRLRPEENQTLEELGLAEKKNDLQALLSSQTVNYPSCFPARRQERE